MIDKLIRVAQAAKKLKDLEVAPISEIAPIYEARLTEYRDAANEYRNAVDNGRPLRSSPINRKDIIYLKIQLEISRNLDEFIKGV